MNRITLIYYIAAAAVSVAACNKSNVERFPDLGSQGGSGDEKVEEINGTKIKDGINAAGIITDAVSGLGIPGVPVTDGYSYTVTDENGVYQMVANRYCRNIYYSLPAGYKTALDKENHLPAFYSTKVFDYKKFNRNDFSIEPGSGNEDNFTFIAIADPQCRNNGEAERFINETLADISETISAGQKEGRYLNAYASTLGDIVHDTPDMWVSMKNSMSDITLQNGTYLPIYQVIGNHDHDAKENTQYNAVKNFISTFGPTDYSYNIGKVHFISMENTICKESSGKTWSYNAGFTSSQIKWLKEDLELVEDKETKMVILNVHIPLRDGATSGGGAVNKDKYLNEVLEMLTQFKEAHIMSAHRHFSQNWVHKNHLCKGGMPIYEHIHAAACGSFWSCNSNLDGSPNGYSIYEIEGSSIKNWIAKGTGRDKDFQIRVYNGNQIYTGDKGYQYTWYSGGTGGSSNITAKGFGDLKGCFVASVWNSDDTYWEVEFYQNGEKIGDMTRVPDWSLSNACASSFYFNQLGKNGSDYCIYESSHYFYFKPDSENPSIEQNWEVRATQTIPGSGMQNTYSADRLQTDYSGF